MVLQELPTDLENFLVPLWRGADETARLCLPVVIVLPREHAPSESLLHAFERRLAATYSKDVQVRLRRRGRQSTLPPITSELESPPFGGGSGEESSDEDEHNLDEPPMPTLVRGEGDHPLHPPVYLIEGTNLHVNTLRRARVSYASRLLLLSGRADIEFPDGPVVLLTTLLESGLRTIQPALLSFLTSESYVPSRSVFMLGPVKAPASGAVGEVNFTHTFRERSSPDLLTVRRQRSTRLREPPARATSMRLRASPHLLEEETLQRAVTMPTPPAAAPEHPRFTPDEIESAAKTSLIAQSLGWRWTSRYAAGRLLDCHSWGTVLLTSAVKSSRLCDLAELVLVSGKSLVVHVEVPELGGQGPPTWARVCAHFALRGGVALGLFRSGGGAPLPYVYANPPLNCRVDRNSDIVFALMPCSAPPAFEPGRV